VEIQPVPAEDFPGTWEGAYHDAAKAAMEISKASKSYINAVKGSGVTKAGRSIGAAFASTANRHALSVAKYAVDATGTQGKLPGPLSEWLKGKDKMEEAKKRAKEAEKLRIQRKYKAELIASGQVVENPNSPLLTSSGPPSQITSPAASLTQSADMLVDRPLQALVDDNAQRGYFGYPAPARPLQPIPDILHPSMTAESPVKSPYSSSNDNVFEALDTPAPVRKQLKQPLAVATTTKDPSTVSSVSIKMSKPY
jgi:hypothetical protein